MKQSLHITMYGSKVYISGDFKQHNFMFSATTVLVHVVEELN